MRLWTLVPVLLVSAIAGSVGYSQPPESAQTDSQRQPLIVFLVRHGERADSSRDTQLSDAGRERSEVLARILRSAEIEYVHSSDFNRTRETAAPVAAAFGLQVQLYDPRNLQQLVADLRSIGGRHLVVGHSNTTPSAVELLGGAPSSPIEPGEFDRLYIVAIGSDGEVISTLIRYGELFDE